MNRTGYIFSVALLLAGAAACTQENLYEQGAAELDGSYGVYFPTQTSATVLELDPLEKKNVTYRVSRENALDAITVPINVTASEEGIFAVEPVVFEAGQKDATFRVDFDAAEIGKTYNCTISIDDPRYVRLYGPKSTSLTFSVVRAAWKALKAPDGKAAKGKWRDDIVGNVFTLNTSTFNRNPELEVSIYEREDQPGYYRMKVYGGSAFLQALAGGSGSVKIDENRDVWTYVDARDPEKVYLPLQSTGLSFSSDYGMCSFGSYVPENFSLDATAAQYGKLKDGVITFPASSIMFTMESITGYYQVNVNGATRVVLPGYTVPDYTVSLSKTEPLNGQVDITARFTSDVASLKYAIFDGVLDDGAASMKAQELEADPSQFEGAITESAKMTVQQGKTGKYTFIGCAYDKEGNMRDYAYIVFGYVAKGDARPVNLTVGLEATNEYAGLGITPDNSGRFYAYGDEVESFTYGLYKKSAIAGYSLSSLLEESGTSFTAEQLESINSKYFSRMVTGLNGDTTYRLVLRASNGYTTRLWYIDYTTTGTFNPGIETDWRYRDFLDEQPSSSELKSKVWNYYAVNLMDSEPTRRYIGKVRFSDDEDYPDDEQTALSVTGLTGITYDSGGSLSAISILESPVTKGYNGAFVLYVDGSSYTGTKNGESIFTGYVADESNSVYAGYGFFFGAVADGYIYGVPSPAMASQGITYRYLYTASSSAAYSIMTQMLLVDPDKDMGGISDSSTEALAAEKTSVLGRISSAAPRNYVELPEYSEPVHETPVNLARTLIPASAPEFGRADGLEIVAVEPTDGGSDVTYTLAGAPQLLNL